MKQSIPLSRMNSRNWTYSRELQDVYKRQLLDGGRELLVHTHISQLEGRRYPTDPVSYTHLDVYKRQPVSRV